MYTQCPDCEIAFKVTADVLKQAAGKVRCGGCGNAFNALAYLSEQMPKRPAAASTDEALPELKPEIIETDSGGLPKYISAEQSAALLKTLDELAGSDIRIEDTGVEWRVLDEDAAAAPAADDDDAKTPVGELRFDDNTPLPDEFRLDEESPYTPKTTPAPEEEVADVSVEAVQPEIMLSEPDEWTDILGEFQELAAEVAAPVDVELDTEPEMAAEDDELVDAEVIEESSIDQPLDMDTQFALQAEAMGIDLSGINDLDEEPEEAFAGDLEDEPLDEEPIADLEEDSLESPQEDLEEDFDEELDDDFDEDLDEESEEDLEEGIVDEPEEDFEDESDEELQLAGEITQLNLIDDPAELIDEPVIESHTIESELAGLSDEPPSADEDEFANDDSDEHYVPPMTEEEQTVNMQIDQDLMALAIEDDDGFASTIVIPQKDHEKKASEEKTEFTEDDGAEKPPSENDRSLFETIIMEGDHVRSEQDMEKLTADAAAAAELNGLARANDVEQPTKSGRVRFGMIAGIVVLMLLFAVQLMHQSREALATIPAFSNTFGQIYRAIGQPVQPAWDITGWRFEATKGSAEGEEEELTVYSRLGNKSDGPLPYPLIGISLTDRFEETIGSRMLEPAEYLPTDLDPRKLVEPGNTFNAVITINSTSEDATGFKLNVCYRLSDGQLRCAIDDFR